ncbi:hypothetical protein M3P05_03640 [Sansalvadorimonas sp. 2012CJ34-2]|uniref:Uncharacterized protein n=1 Tax=Parendozoicomonas callyspongiae TaxID=2942213 RepID=A0ABT0PCI7_9GAMM|nr:hypothetical protein [Sansalvadorimonas sp. 2012CJ34-2]MCL6269035.1 hypothetical protein [Sansalvadorimonas sp. 2012CJ34-2]
MSTDEQDKKLLIKGSGEKKIGSSIYADADSIEAELYGHRDDNKIVVIYPKDNFSVVIEAVGGESFGFDFVVDILERDTIEKIPKSAELLLSFLVSGYALHDFSKTERVGGVLKILPLELKSRVDRSTLVDLEFHPKKIIANAIYIRDNSCWSHGLVSLLLVSRFCNDRKNQETFTDKFVGTMASLFGFGGFVSSCPDEEEDKDELKKAVSCREFERKRLPPSVPVKSKKIKEVKEDLEPRGFNIRKRKGEGIFNETAITKIRKYSISPNYGFCRLGGVNDIALVLNEKFRTIEISEDDRAKLEQDLPPIMTEDEIRQKYDFSFGSGEEVLVGGKQQKK